MQWYNEPPKWRAEGETLTATAGARTDFWRKTHDGGMRDHGHFYYKAVTGDFTARVKLIGQYVGLYDHAGLMVRVDEAHWLKCGIEFVNGVQNASVVVTRDWSDWSILPLANPPAMWLQVVRRGVTLEISFSLDGESYTMIRQAFLTEAATVQVGPMLAAPVGAGFEARFEGLRIE